MNALLGQPNLFLQVPITRKIAPRKMKDLSAKVALLYDLEREIFS